MKDYTPEEFSRDNLSPEWQTLNTDTMINGFVYAKGSKYMAKLHSLVFASNTKLSNGDIPIQRFFKW